MEVNGSIKTNGVAKYKLNDDGLRELDASRLIIQPSTNLKTIPDPSDMLFGKNMTDHMLVVSYDPTKGWSDPIIQPYQPLQLDPASSCFQYCPNVFEGMKAYLGSDGVPRLFRPELNMSRMQSSVERVALPSFDTSELLTLLKHLVNIDKRWIPSLPGYSLYIRPTIIGTRPQLGVTASDHALLYVIMCPTGPYFPGGLKPISLLAEYENVRSWPGGTGAFKLGLNYAPCFKPQKKAAGEGCDQILWLLEDGGERKVTEAGAMNFFIVVEREDKDWDVITPPLDGTILPGVTRQSVLELIQSNASSPLLKSPSNNKLTLHFHAHSTSPLTMSTILKHSTSGKLLEAFCVGTAVVVAPVGRIRYEGKDILLPSERPLANALYEKIIGIQVGELEWKGWSVKCT